MATMKVLISDAVTKTCIAILEQNNIAVDYRPGLSADELRKVIPEFDGLIVRSATKVTAEIIKAASNLRVIGRAGTGVDNIDVAAATGQGIVVLNSRGGNTLSAAELTFALMMSLARNIPAAHASMTAGKWERSKFVGVELSGKKLGIVGFGQIGKEVAKRAQAFGMIVSAFDPLLEPADFSAHGVTQEPVDDLLRTCDFMTLHVPLMDATRHMISEAQFEICNPNLKLINVARGGIVDEAALERALTAGKLAGAALDVFENEPPGDNPLIGLDKIITTPHLGARTIDAQERIAREIAETVAHALHGREVSNLVNPNAAEPH